MTRRSKPPTPVKTPPPPRHVSAGDGNEPPRPNRAELARQRASAVLVPKFPAGVPYDPAELLAFLQAGVFTPAQLVVLRDQVLPNFSAGVVEIREKGAPAAITALAERILAAVQAVLQEHPAPAAGNPFNAA